jgi:hypothetical protein
MPFLFLLSIPELGLHFRLDALELHMTGTIGAGIVFSVAKDMVQHLVQLEVFLFMERVTSGKTYFPNV